MSFTPLSGGLSSALSGAVEPSKFIGGTSDQDLYSKRIHAPADRSESIRFTIYIVIISAIIFVTVIALYDILRNTINYIYANKALVNPDSHNTPEDIQRTQIANLNTLWSSIVFAVICLVLAIIFIFLLIYFLRYRSH